ncbi:MAG: DUF2281 domain-containing protein [Anaerolineae bacterium]|nr:DUF2281 domain-containing protein [Anaerolineae bacterium]
MEVQVRSLVEMIEALPPELQREVQEFVRSLARRTPRSARRLRQDWAGALREYRDRYTAMELQRKAIEWRGD